MAEFDGELRSVYCAWKVPNVSDTAQNSYEGEQELL